MATGFVYIMSNPSFNCIKVGQSSKHPSHRAKDLYEANTSVPSEFVIEGWVMVEAYENVERLVHEELQEYRVNKSREFFNCSVVEAARTLSNVLDREKIIPEGVSVPWPSENSTPDSALGNRERSRNQSSTLQKIIGLTKCFKCGAQRNYSLYTGLPGSTSVNIKCWTCGHWTAETVAVLLERRRSRFCR